jgi:AcrR family transcriptional regulator
MARPADPEKKSALAWRAVEVLEREGLGISVARLAEAIGIKRPTLLYHFPTYGHVVEAALQDLLTEQTAYVLARVERHEHPIDRLFSQVQAVHAFHQGRERRIVFLTQAIAATAGTRASAILEAGNLVFEAHRRAAADRLRQGIAQGIVAPCDADALVALVRSVIDGLMVQRVVSGLDFAPVHALLWERVLAPLKLTKARRKPRPSSRKKKPR